MGHNQLKYSIEFLRDKLARVRRGHVWPKNTRIENVEYGEVQKEGFTQIYVNGELGCVVTRRLGNVEHIVWSDELTETVWSADRTLPVKVVEERWERGVFKEMGAAVEYDRGLWDLFWTRDNEWHKHATEFYLEAEGRIDVANLLSEGMSSSAAYTTKVKTDILEMWKQLPRRKGDSSHPFFEKIEEGVELFWVYRPVLKGIPNGASDWFPKARSVDELLTLIKDKLLPMLAEAERLGAAEGQRLAFDGYARGRLLDFKEYVASYWEENNASAPAHVDPGQKFIAEQTDRASNKVTDVPWVEHTSRGGMETVKMKLAALTVYMRAAE